MSDKPTQKDHHANSGQVPGQMDVFDVLADVEANGLTPGEHNDRPRTLKEKAQDGDRPMTAREIVQDRLRKDR